MKKDTLLLHVCCAPCAAHVYESLQKDYLLSTFFYNPNIAPFSEYQKRLQELQRYALKRGFPLIEGPYDVREWTLSVKPYRFAGERSERCMQCFLYRLERSFQYARDHFFDAVTTVLSISPHKDADMINEAGRRLKKRYGIGFIEADFKKNDGFKKSIEKSREHGFYRQTYCGCVYSKMERKKPRTWNIQPKSVNYSPS